MRRIVVLGVISVLLLNGCNANRGTDMQGSEKPNVLLICIDDLRPELSCYGAGHIHSPNIDALAREAVLFTRAYTQQAVCAPSRNTLMTGMRPDGLGIYDLSTFFRTKEPELVSLTQHFIHHGYQAEGMGKIYHVGHGNQDDTLSWSIPHWSPSQVVSERVGLQSGDTTRLQTCYPFANGKCLPWYRSGMPEMQHDDALVTTHAINRMEALKDQSFFLAVGLVKPHLPFVAPSKYWDLYNPGQIEVPGPEKPDAPSFAFTSWGELRKYHGIPSEGPLPREDALQMIHGYYACVSFIDAQVGRLVRKLKELDLYDNTIIVLWGDHGWKLGEYGDWCKHTNFELDTRIPVIVRDPREKDNAGKQSGALIETVDIYPTLCELAGLSIPGHVQGSSFMKILSSPGLKGDEVAFSQYPRTAMIDGRKTRIMGYSMRTEDYRVIRWIDRENRETLATEVYRHMDSETEKANLANDPGNKELVEELNQLMEEYYSKEHGKELLE